mmetsp:Transcript_28359/g.52315  ORF Transcript_28359/g.52315 Transcript_28359/m.52315 type:complete len:314 (-) Transcript_28359:60-1001(-)
MKRPVAIVGICLASFSLGTHGRSCGFVPSYISTSSRSIVDRKSDPSINVRVRRNHHHGKDICATRTTHANPYNNPIVCHMSKNKVSEKVEQEQSSKRGVFKRMREKISSTFSGSKKGDVSDGGVRENEYKPNPMDAIRLRLAVAMSKLNLFQSGKEEWVVACSKTRVGPGQIIPCVVNGLDIIVFASRDGQRLNAFANACPHLGSPFDLGTVERKPPIQGKGRADDGTGDGCVDCIVCPVHRTAFEIESGVVQGEWCPYPPIIGGIMGYVKPKSGLVKFAVRLKGKNVEVRIATSLANVGKGEEEADGIKGMK